MNEPLTKNIDNNQKVEEEFLNQNKWMNTTDNISKINDSKDSNSLGQSVDTTKTDTIKTEIVDDFEKKNSWLQNLKDESKKLLNKPIDVQSVKKEISTNIGLKKETTKDTPEFVKTGVMGFDDMITSGIPRGSQILISGGPGTLKSTFCLQVLVNNVKLGKKCLFLSFEESKKNIIRNMNTFGWNPDELLKTGKLVIKNMDPFKMSRSVETLLAQARGELLIEVNEAKNLIPDNFKPEIIVIDSLSAISAGFFGKEEGYRAYMSQIFDTFRKIDATAFMITEVEHSTTRYSNSGVEEFLADAVFVFYNFRQGNERVNATEIVKLRGTQHKKRIVPFKVRPNMGIVVYPMEELFVN